MILQRNSDFCFHKSYQGGTTDYHILDVIYQPKNIEDWK